MSLSPLGAELLGALESDRGRALLVEAVRQALETQTAPVWLDSAALARRCGFPSVRALNQLLYRRRTAGEPHPLEAMAQELDGRRRWRAADVDAWLAREGGAR